MKNKYVKVLLGIILMAGIIGYFAIPSAAAEGIVINIPDAGLKTQLNRALGQADTADITDTQMETLTNLSTTASPSIADFTGIEYAINLQSLSATSFTGADITPLTALINLTNLNLGGANVTTLPDMNGMTALQSFHLTSSISSDEFVKFNQLPNLNYFWTQGNMRITDISALASLPNLTQLSVQNCGITDFTAINNFPKLASMAGALQNTGRYDPVTPLHATNLQYDQTAGTIYFPFSMMPNRLTNFDGEQSPFSTSTSPSNTFFGFNDVALPASRLTIDANGITVSGVTREEFDGIEMIEYNARYAWSAGQYASPPGYTFYSISGGTYDHYFSVDHTVVITADPQITYDADSSVSEAQFLSDIHALTNDGSPITSDFLSQVNFAVPGSYTVTLNAENTLGVKAEPVQVTVIIKATGPVNPTDNNSSANNSSSNNNGLPETGQNLVVPLLAGSSLLFIASLILFKKRK
ncbi:LapB repeat-containing protein [Culicoidibacter larvae]|uniref:Leucine-rich repeat domain-containing protein n=1 Tax=Culicoidibacter larvae TaxID=2579976 RepID=A0A5R8QGY1_9FIRM|nr:LapB repeat-containing protein [Culicoidibacter larvae]TLG77275.1 leucine-rich repeat domain-containing protein [Culicoidibacter larvae]